MPDKPVLNAVEGSGYYNFRIAKLLRKTWMRIFASSYYNNKNFIKLLISDKSTVCRLIIENIDYSKIIFILKTMADLHLDEIIKCLGKVAKILHNKPKEALQELRDISSLIDNQVPYRDGHNKRVSEYSLKIGKQLGLTDKEMVILETAALLHDFGKIGVDEEILLKPGPLTKSEKIEIEKHVLRGYYILSGFAELEEALEGVRSHHEHYNGSGYPERLLGDNIPLLGRILAVADAYDAMTSERPYRKAKTKEQAIEELKKFSGTQFDPEVVEVFIKILQQN
jgi:HD-GYP domain-containing protein (c-di-GMP phosphodiesterase class II)